VLYILTAIYFDNLCQGNQYLNTSYQRTPYQCYNQSNCWQLCLRT